MDNIQGVFFSKENISNLNKDLLEKLKIKNLSQEIRKDIVETIVDNMKQTWSKIDKTKVNNNNINNILSQFNSYSSDQSHITLKNKYNSNYTGIHSNTSQQQNIPNQKQQNIPNQQQQNIPNQQQQNIPRQQHQNIPSPQQNIPRQQQQNISSQQQYAPSQQQYAPSQQQVNNDLNQFYNNINPNIPDNFIDPDYNSSSLKFQRDFTINQGKQNQIPDRSTSILGANEKYIRNAQETQRLASNFQPSIDNVFKPLIDNDQLASGFNNYNFNKNEGDVKQKMDDVRFNRENEIYMPKKQQNEIPDFLKPKCTSIRTPDEYKNTIQVNQLKEKEQNPNIKTKKSIKSGSQSNNEFLSGLNDFSEDLMSINNFDKKITDDNIEEDNTPFSDRLSRLKADRDSVNVPRSGKIDFTSEHFEDTYDDIEPTTIKDLIKKKTQNEYIEIEDDVTYDEDYELNQRKQYETNQREQYESRQKEQYELNQRKQYESRQREQYESNQHDINNKDQNLKNIGNKDEIKELYLNYLKLQKNNEILTNENNILKKNTSKKLNKIEKKEYIEIFNDLKKINDKISEELKNYKTEKNMYMNEFNSLKEKYTLLNENYILLKETNSKPKELIDLEKIKNDISNEFKELSSIKEQNENELNIIKKEKNELEININEYKTIIEEYNKINNTKFYQMEIHNENFSSYYTYNFEKLDNIASIKLLSYSIPSINFNIEEDKNNIFEFEFEANDVIEIKLESGKYGIDELLNSLNKNEYGLIFSLDNITQKVTVSSEKEFKINPSPLSISNLFFTDNNYENLKEYKATKIFDLRSDNKISLYLNNIDNNSPFAILYPESTSNAILNFENLISLEKLDILFKDSKGRIHNFYNSEHNISLQLEVKN